MSNGGPLRLLSATETEKLIAERTSAVDAMVRDAFALTLQAEFPEGITTLAVGGFGRRELFPCSDVDVLVLVRDSLEPSRIKEPVGRFVQRLWDSNLRLSHSVRTIADCAQLHDGNTELSISLIDRRYLAGDAALFDELQSRMPKFFRLHGRTLARHLSKLTRARHSKFQNTIYHLEPSLKDTPGGLRDVHCVHWLSKLTEVSDVPDLAAARAFLFPLRVFLHQRARRDDNVLSFDAQEEISGQPAEMMRSYYRYAREIDRAASALLESSEETERSLLGQFRDWRSRLSNSDVTVARDRLFVRYPLRLATEPAYLMRVFEFAGRHGILPALDTERRAAEAVPSLKPADLWPPFRDILKQPHASVALRAMESSGILRALIPEWARIECLVVRDFYHRYTVDEHTLVAVTALEHLDSDRRFQDLMTEVDRPWVLRLALLLHDIGKGSGNHVAIGLELARTILSRLKVPEDDAETVMFLIAQHLALSSVMTSRDLADTRTAQALAKAVGTVERLKLLTLLTYADISAVNPTAMTPWRREQLWRAYLAAHQELTRELDTDRIHAAAGAPQTGMQAFLEGLPTRYARTHTGEEMHRHFQLWSEAQREGVAVDIERLSGFYRLVVATPDRPGIFAALSGALSAFGMNILKAEAFANSAGFIFDTFTFADPMRTLELNPSEFDRLRETVARVVLGKQDVRKLLANRPRPGKRPQRVKPTISFDNEASPSATLIEIVAEDRPGLLYDLSSTMSQAGCNIEVVLIDTEAQKALDVFYVTAAGAKVADQLRSSLQSSLLDACSS